MNIFISYNRKSEAITKALADDIEALGHTVWFDQELSGGQAWWDQILAMVRNCDLFVFILDPESLNSTACKREYGYAVDVGKSILPVLVSEGVNINLLPPALSQIQFVDYRKQDRNAAFRLARAISTAPPPKPLSDPLPSAPEAPISYLGSLTAQVETSTLSYEQQSALVFDLKRSLRDPGNADDTRALLEKLRKRRDLFATIAEEIDEILGTIRKATPPVLASKITLPSPKLSPGKESLSILAEYEPSEERESQPSAVQPVQTDGDQRDINPAKQEHSLNEGKTGSKPVPSTFSPSSGAGEELPSPDLSRPTHTLGFTVKNTRAFKTSVVMFFLTILFLWLGLGPLNGVPSDIEIVVVWLGVICGFCCIVFFLRAIAKR